MADPRFFTVAGPFTLGELAARIGAEIGGSGDRDKVLRDVAPISVAGPDDLSFLDNRKYLDAFRATKAGAIIVDPSLAAQAPAGAALLLTADPYRAYARAAQAFYSEHAPPPGIAPSAVIDPSARLGEGCSVAPNAVIEAEVEIGQRCRIGANSVIARGCKLGDDVKVGANVTLSHCLIGSRVTFFPGVRVGQDGFGFAAGPSGVVKVPQLGRVVIDDDVEIGANTTIDRGAGPDTVIGAGTMIDNLVQIGHNVRIGRGCILVAQVGISGSTQLEDYVVVAGQVGVAGHVTIGKGAKIGAQAGIIGDIPAGATVVGSPAKPRAEFFREVVALARLAKKKGQ